MCYPVNCSKCGKTSWGGCGRHVRSVYENVPQGQHCLCKEWPGVPSEAGANKPTDQAIAADSSSSSWSSKCRIM